MFWDGTGFSEPAQIALRAALLETSMRAAEPEHALLAALGDDDSPVVKACRFLRAAFVPQSLRNNIILRIQSSLSVDPPPPWNDQLVHPRLRDALTASQALPEWAEANADLRDQLVCAEIVHALKPGVKTVLNASGIVPDELEARLRKPAMTRDPAQVLWDSAGQLNLSVFDRAAQKVLRLMETEGQGRGLNRLVTSLALFAFVSVEGGLLSTGLRLQAPVVDVKKLRDNLSLHVQSLGTGRFHGELRLHREQIQAGVLQMLERALAEADAVEAPRIGEAELLKAFLLVGDPFVDSFLRNEQVDLGELSRYVSQRRTGEVLVGEPEPPKLLNVSEIEERLRNHIVGQDHAIDTVMPMIKRLRFGYLRRGRPAGVLLFVGLSGTGKTQLAKEIAHAVYGSEEQLIFLEMGQFGNEYSKTSFVGAPPGLVGYGEGILTNGLRDKPESVVLFDEVEKAHKSVFDVVLRFLDEGQISDAGGAVRDGRRCLLVLTSNLGVRELARLIDEQTSSSESASGRSAAVRAKVRETLLNIDFFRPEFLNRVDEIVLFNSFTEKSFRRIIDNLLAQEERRFREEKDFAVRFDSRLRDVLVARCMERADEGARVCGRMISDYVVTPVIDFFLDPAHADVRGAAVELDSNEQVSVRSFVP